MNATHQAYARAHEALLAAQAALEAAFVEADLAPGPPPIVVVGVDDPTKITPLPDPVAAERADLAEAQEALQAAAEPLAEEIEAAWQTNVAEVQAAKLACRAAAMARAAVEAEIAGIVNDRLRDPTWPPDAPLVTEAEQARVDAAVDALQRAAEANGAAEARFKLGVLPEQLAAT